MKNLLKFTNNASGITLIVFIVLIIILLIIARDGYYVINE